MCVHGRGVHTGVCDPCGLRHVACIAMCCELCDGVFWGASRLTELLSGTSAQGQEKHAFAFTARETHGAAAGHFGPRAREACRCIYTGHIGPRPEF